MATAQTLINSALRQLGVYESAETLSADDSVVALESLNQMIDSWGLARNRLYTERNEIFSLTAGKTEYTIGEGADFDTVRPVRILNCFVRDDSSGTNIDYRVKIISNILYQKIGTKNVTSSYPDHMMYLPEYPIGKVFVYPEPINSWSLGLTMYDELQGDLKLSTTLSYPPGYLRYLKLALAVEIAPEFGVPVSNELVSRLRDAKVSVERMNLRVPTLEVKLPYGTTKRVYSIYKDS